MVEPVQKTDKSLKTQFPPRQEPGPRRPD